MFASVPICSRYRPFRADGPSEVWSDDPHKTERVCKGYTSILQLIARLSSVPHRLCLCFSPEAQPSKRQRKGVMSAAGDGSANGATAEASKKVNFSHRSPVIKCPVGASGSLMCWSSCLLRSIHAGYSTSSFHLARSCSVLNV